MSFVTSIKDYIDVLNNVYDSASGNPSFQELFQQSFIYFISVVKTLIVYILSFQWFRDLSYLPILIPQISTKLLTETYFLDTPLANFFTLLETPTYGNNKFIIGFLNSFFVCLPISITHLISIRRLLIQGIPAGIISSLGTIFGHIFFIVSVVFGLRLFIIPWLSYEPLSYIIGIFLTLSTVYEMAHENTIRKFNWSQQYKLLQIFSINFILSWTEQSCMFSYFGNITLNSQPTILSTFSSNSGIGSILSNGSYLLGLIFGSLFFTTLFIILCLQLNTLFLKVSGVSYSYWLRKTNLVLLTFILGFTFTSIPFYSLEYLFTGPLGFVSQDKTFDKTFLSSKNISDSSERLGGYSNFKSLDTDITPFDRGQYLLPDTRQSFEDLNYQGEYAWTARQDRVATYQTQQSRKLLSNFFKQTENDLSLQEPNSKILENKSSEENKISLNKISSVEKENLEKTHIELNNQDLFLDVNTNDQKSGPSDYFFQLNDRINNQANIVATTGIAVNQSFSPAFIKEDENNIDTLTEKKIKQKYYSNPVYKLLLNVDIDLFLRRQPSTYSLSPSEEANLFKKRLILSDYYDSLRYYQKLPYLNDFQTFFNGTKSYADRVYNQQFKGTLKVVRRLFSITLNEENSKSNKITLKFDQPLYKDLNYTNSRFLHEEVDSTSKKNKPFIQLTNPIPFYTGWDEQLRKFVITNRLLPRSAAGYTMKLDNSAEIKNSSQLKKIFNKTNQIDFTMWPLPENVLQQSKNSLTIPYTLLYEQLNDPKNTHLATLLSSLEYEDWQEERSNTIPSNLKKLDPDQLTDVVPPNRGGFIWPGHSYLKINLKKLIKN